MPGWLLLLVIILILAWGGGYWYGPSPVRSNNLVHVLLVIALVLVVLHFSGHRFR